MILFSDHFRNASKYIKKMKKSISGVFPLLIIPLLSFGFLAQAQEGHDSFYHQSLRIQNTGMYILGSWAVANIVSGGYGWSRFDGERMYFSQMNLFWNLANASIAGFAVYGNLNADISLLTGTEMLGRHVRTENILLFNTGLDVVYIGTGLLMRHFADRSAKHTDLLNGYGSSLILQGAFLFVCLKLFKSHLKRSVSTKGNCHNSATTSIS